MDRGSTEVEIHCACAWEPDGGRWQLNEKRSRVIVDWRQVAWCRLHMEAEIAKQGQAAGADVFKDSGSPTPSPFANVDTGRASQ